MSEDHIDSLIVDVSDWIESNQPVDLDNDEAYDQLCQIFYDHLEKHCTRDRNYN